MKVVATIEARMTSSRLPGKVMLPANGKPMLEHLVERLKRVPSLSEIVLATTVNATDNLLVDFASSLGIKTFRGSEKDVMSRVLEAGKEYAADVIVEITADCPVIDSEIIEQTIQLFFKTRCDYSSNVQVRSYPIGMDTQVYSLKTLQKSFGMTSDPLDREHVTRHIRLNPKLFSQSDLVAPPDLHWPELALTLDEPKDYELLRKVIEYFGDEEPNFSCGEIIRLLKEIHPEWAGINQEVRRKGLN